MITSIQCPHTTAAGTRCTRTVSTSFRGTPCCGLHFNFQIRQEDCAICLCSMSHTAHDDPLCHLSCDHVFHKDCLLSCNSATCPLCRAPFDTTIMEDYISFKLTPIVKKIITYVPPPMFNSTITFLNRAVDVVAIGGQAMCDIFTFTFNNVTLFGGNRLNSTAIESIITVIDGLFKTYNRVGNFENIIISGTGDELFVDEEIFVGATQVGIIAGNTVTPAPAEFPSYDDSEAELIEAVEDRQPHPTATSPAYTIAVTMPLGAA